MHRTPARVCTLATAGTVAIAAFASVTAGSANAATLPRAHGFSVDCSFSHTASIDPIVMPGMAGMSHQHEFFGNASTNENSTAATLLAAGTTCTDSADLSSYWVPSLLWNGTRVQPVSMHVQYKAGPGQVTPFPTGFKAVSGRTNTTAAWGCDSPGSPPVMGTSVSTVPTCAAGQHLVARIVFGSCWDGSSLDSTNHASHLVAATDGVCPSDHPVAVPQVTLDVHYPHHVTGGAGVALASGDASTLHGDIFEAWAGDALATRLTAPAPAGPPARPDRAMPPARAGQPPALAASPSAPAPGARPLPPGPRQSAPSAASAAPGASPTT